VKRCRNKAGSTRRALAPGVEGWVEDDLAFAKPWGFDLAAIAVPVHVWQGDLDRMVRAARGPSAFCYYIFS